MNHSLTTPRGTILFREVNPADAVAFRELRLEALQDSPIAFSADYQKTLNQPAKYWEDMLRMEADESTIFIASRKTSSLA